MIVEILALHVKVETLLGLLNFFLIYKFAKFAVVGYVTTHGDINEVKQQLFTLVALHLNILYFFY